MASMNVYIRVHKIYQYMYFINLYNKMCYVCTDVWIHIGMKHDEMHRH